MWQQLHDSLEIRPTPKGYRPVRPTSESISAFEHTHKFQFPKSYLEFLREIGPGLIAGYFNIHAPGGGLEENQASRDENLETLKKIFGDVDMLSRMIEFGGTIGGDLIVWDPNEITDSQSNEYGIYVVPRNDDKISRLAATFREFIDSVCFGKGFDAISGGRKGGRPREFEPFFEKAKK